MENIAVFISILLIGFIYGDSSINVKKYLGRFGYYDDHQHSGYKANEADLLKEAIIKFQHTHGLNITGVVDEKTKALINTPRCGLSDKIKANRLNDKWNKLDLTYYFNNYTPDLTRDEVTALTKQALKYWSDVTPLKFTQTNSDGDIVMHFGSSSHHDGRRTCRSPFDGPSGVLAHAFFPPDGRLHFDEDENYTSRKNSGINYLWVATHELGHILGLEHDTVNRDAVMYPYYRAYNPNGMRLHPNDIKRIQEKYGRGGITPVNTDPPLTPPPSDCQDRTSNCNELIKYCRKDAGWTSYMKDHCKRTCGFCGTSTQLPKRTTLAPSQAPKGTTITPQKCKDISSNCVSMIQNCRKDDTWIAFNKKYCKRTCGFCGAETQPPTRTTMAPTQPPTRTTVASTQAPKSTTIATTQPSKATTTIPQNCQDRASNCNQIKNYCRKDDLWTNYMKEHCKRTCGFCGAGTQPPKRTTITTTTQPSTITTIASTQLPKGTTITPQNCGDVSSNCHYLRNHCFLNDDIMDFTMRECKATCGYCDGPATDFPPTTKPGVCVDISINCEEMKSMCRYDSMQRNCKKTCNLC